MSAPAPRRFGRLQIGRLGFGGAPLGNLYAPIDEEVALATVRKAWDVGVRFFDTAPHYGHGLSEHRIGHVLRQHNRDDYMLATKVGRILTPKPDAPKNQFSFFNALPFMQHFDYSYDGAMRSLSDSMQRLGVPRIDAVFIHDLGSDTHNLRTQPEMFRAAMDGTYRALDRLRSEGVIGAIGLGVNDWKVCLMAMEHGNFDGFLLAGRYTLIDQTALPELLPECVRRGAVIVLGGPYNSGILASGAKPGATFNYKAAPPELIERVAKIEAVCERLGVSLRAAALQFPFGHPAIAAVIPGARTPEEVAENVALMNEPIAPAFWAALKSEGLLPADVPVPA